MVNEDVNDVLSAPNGFLPDGGDTFPGSIIPLIADLDCRDAEDDNSPPALTLDTDNCTGGAGAAVTAVITVVPVDDATDPTAVQIVRTTNPGDPHSPTSPSLNIYNRNFQNSCRA